MPTFKLTLEYDGTAYVGWQRQPHHPTVQAALETALHRITHTDLTVIGASRTDAGVHALGQVAGFRSDRELTPEEWTRGINALLPDDISVRHTECVADDFHARYAARGKLYEYRILNRRARSAFEHGRAWHCWGELSVETMQAAAECLLGSHDFSSFEGPQTDIDNKICDLHRLDVSRAGDLILIHAEGDRFLKQMVRAIVGTLVETGQGKRPPESMRTILRSKDRRAAGYTAPAHGLYLVRVDY